MKKTISKVLIFVCLIAMFWQNICYADLVDPGNRRYDPSLQTTTNPITAEKNDLLPVFLIASVVVLIIVVISIIVLKKSDKPNKNV